jgi:cysteine sulfinate desulfinase/cysteine desulfurase-like protein
LATNDSHQHHDANNEIGVVQPIAEIGAIAKRKAFFSTDAVRLGKSVQRTPAIWRRSAHKIRPKGVGVLRTLPTRRCFSRRRSTVAVTSAACDPAR